MKKLSFLALIMAVSISFAGCGSNDVGYLIEDPEATYGNEAAEGTNLINWITDGVGYFDFEATFFGSEDEETGEVTTGNATAYIALAAEKLAMEIKVEANGQSQTYRMIKRDEKSYIISDADKQMMVGDASDAGSMEIFETDFIDTPIEEGKTIYEDKEVDYQVYANAKDEEGNVTSTTKFLLENGQVVAISAVSEGGEETILKVKNAKSTVSSTLFNIPNYEILEASE